MKLGALLCTLVALFGACLSEDNAGILFATPGQTNGLLGGAAGADALCRGLTGNYSFVALLSSTNEELTAVNRLHDGYSYYNTQGQLIGNNTELFNSLGSNVLLKHQVLDLNGVSLSPLTRAYTGSFPDGSQEGDDCDSWTTSSGSIQGAWGLVNSTEAESCFWTFAGTQVCSSLSRIYCVQQQLVVCIFTTDDVYPSGNASLFDQACLHESPRFQSKAVFGTSTREIGSSFPGGEGSYLLINTRGEFLNSLRYDLFRSGSLFGSNILNRHEVVTDGNVWTGFGTDNCNDFTSTSNGDSAVIGNASAIDGTLFNSGLGSCNSSYYLYCAQQDQIGTASAHGDPHFKGFDGSKYNFMGADGEIFAIISDVGFALNAEFRRMVIYGRDGTWMTKVGIRVHDETLVYDPRFGLLVNGEIITKDLKTKEFDIIIAHDGFEVVCASVGYGVSVASVSFRTEFGLLDHFLDVQVSLLATPVKPHGVLGQTALFIAKGEKPQPIASNDDNGKGVVEGMWSDYLIRDGLTGTDFNFSTFESSAPIFTGTGHGRTARAAMTGGIVKGSFVGFSPLL